MSVMMRRGTFRAKDLERPGMPEKFVEIIEGELIQMTPAAWYHNRIGGEFFSIFREFCKTRPELTYGTDNDGFLIEKDPDTLVSPDACLWRRRPPSQGIWFEFPPDIAVEVLSRSNRPPHVADKLAKYLAAGSEQVWIADPEAKSVEIHLRDGRRVIARGDEIITGVGIAQGMEIRLAEIFKEP